MGSLLVLIAIGCLIGRIFSAFSKRPKNGSEQAGVPPCPPIPSSVELAKQALVAIEKFDQSLKIVEVGATLENQVNHSVASKRETLVQIRQLWRTGQFEPLNLARAAFDADNERVICKSVLLRVWTLIAKVMVDLGEFDLADEACASLPASIRPDTEFVEVMTTSLALFDEEVTTIAASNNDAAKETLGARLFRRGVETKPTSQWLKRARLEHGNTSFGDDYRTLTSCCQRFEWAARLMPRDGKANFETGLCFLKISAERYEQGDTKSACKTLWPSREYLRTASILIPEDELVWKKLEEAEEALIRLKCSKL